jgi:hypothetical protein
MTVTDDDLYDLDSTVADLVDQGYYFTGPDDDRPVPLLLDGDVDDDRSHPLAMVVDKPGSGVELVNWSAFWSTDSPPVDWLAEPLLARGRGHALFATAKTGKSLLSLSIAAALATGRAVLDQPAGEPIDVLVIDLEMSRDDLRERLSDMGYGPSDDLSRLHYAMLPSLPPLDTPAGGRAVVGLAEQVAAELVIVDTFGRAVEGEENSADTVRRFYSCTGLPLKRLGITWVRIDHAGHGGAEHARGSSSKSEDVDVVWRLKAADAGGLQAESTARMPWIPHKVALARAEDPLRFETTGSTWPAGTAELAQLLDQLEVPSSASIATVTELLRGRATPRRRAVVGAAQRFRRSGLQQQFPSAGNHPGTGSGNHAEPFLTGNRKSSDSGTGSGTASDRQAGVPEP